MIEDLVDNNNLVCLNDGRGIRVNMLAGTELASDITLMPSSLANVSDLDVWTATTVGSNHYSVSCSVGGRVEVRPNGNSSF